MSRPPVSKVTPLPMIATFGACSRPQVKSTILGRSAAARPTAWTSGKFGGEERVAPDHADACVETLGEPDRLLFERMRPEHVRRRVDEITAKGDRVGDSFEPPGVDVFGRNEARLWRRIGLEPVVTVEAKKEAERRELGVGRRVHETVDAFGQEGRELARSERIATGGVRRVDPEENADRAARAGQNEKSSSPRLETAALGEGRAGFADRLLDLVPVFRARKPDRGGVRRRRGECVQGPSPSVRRTTGLIPGFE